MYKTLKYRLGRGGGVGWGVGVGLSHSLIRREISTIDSRKFRLCLNFLGHVCLSDELAIKGSHEICDNCVFT